MLSVFQDKKLVRLVCAVFCISAGSLFFSACEKKETVVVPHEQNDLLLDILNDFDAGKYEAVRPKIVRYQTIEDNIVFWNTLEELSLTNEYVVKIRAALDKADYAGAEKLVEELLSNHQALPERLELKDFVSALREADECIRILKKQKDSASLKKAAERLHVVSRKFKEDSFFRDYAVAMQKEAETLERIEDCRPMAWLYFDALDAEQNGDRKLAAAIAASLDSTGTAETYERARLIYKLKENGVLNPVLSDEAVETIQNIEKNTTNAIERQKE